MQEALNQALSGAYQSILTDENLASLSQVEAYLGGVFLPSAPAKPVSLMIIGRENSGERRTSRNIQNIALSNTLQPRLSTASNLLSGRAERVRSEQMSYRLQLEFQGHLWQEAPCPFFIDSPFRADYLFTEYLLP